MKRTRVGNRIPANFRFNHIDESPLSFDQRMLNYFYKRYKKSLVSHKQSIIDNITAEGLESEKYYLSKINWNTNARFLIMFYISADALNINIEKLQDIISCFFRTRVIPISIFNKAMDNENEFNLSLVGIFNSLMQLNSSSYLKSLGGGDDF